MEQQKPNSYSEHLNFIVSTLHKKTKSKTKQQVPQSSTQSLKKLYQTMKNVVKGFDQKISQCKKYNQAKIHRKYQIIINTLQQRIQYLEEILKEQAKARSPSKKYVDDLIEKLVKNKFQIEQINKKYNLLLTENNEIKKKLKIYQENQRVNQNYQPNPNSHAQSHKTQGRPLQQISGSAIKNQINLYLKLKSQLRRHEKSSKSIFQRFLIKNKQKIQSWSFRQLLQSIDKWTFENFDPLQHDKMLISTEINRKLKNHNMSANYDNQYNSQSNDKQEIRNVNSFHFVSNKKGFRSYILK